VRSFAASLAIAVFALFVMASTPSRVSADTFTYDGTPVAFSSDSSAKTLDVFFPDFDLGDYIGFSLYEDFGVPVGSISIDDFKGGKLVGVDTFTNDFVTNVIGLGDEFEVFLSYSSASSPTSSVPEPSTLALLGSSVLGLVVISRKKLLA
jgi:PEP-CTERM motif